MFVVEMVKMAVASWVGRSEAAQEGHEPAGHYGFKVIKPCGAVIVVPAGA